MRRAIVAVAVLVLLAGTLLAPPRETLATWTEPEYSQGSFSAPTLPNVPGSIGCTDHSGGLLPSYVTVSWTAASLPAGAEYEVRLTKGTSTASFFTTALSQDIAVSGLDLLGFLLGSSGAVAVDVRTVFRSGTTVYWTSASATSRTVKYTAPVLGLLLGGFTCV